MPTGYRITFLRRGEHMVVLPLFTGEREEIFKEYEGKVRDFINAVGGTDEKCTLVTRTLEELTVGRITPKDMERAQHIPPWLRNVCNNLLGGPKLWEPPSP